VRRRVTGKPKQAFRRLPLGSLRVFVAVAQALSFTRAADSLGLSVSAASLQIRVLEEYLGHALFRRNGREVALTHEGVALLPRVQAALEMLESALDGARAARETGVLRVTTLSSFLQQWLLPRLPDFRALHPHLEFHFHTSASVVDFVREDCHVAIRIGSGPWPGHHVEPLMPEWLIPVCTPALLQRFGTVVDIASLGRYALLHSTTEPWTSWLLGGSLSNPPDPPAGSSLDDSLALIRMAERGQGLALARWSLVAGEIADGTLVAAGRPVQFQRSYWVVCPARLRHVVAVKAFMDWLLAEAAKFSMPS
jgi:LysR family transcriptional regulator, glycine cleavage system transcriptional activator